MVTSKFVAAVIRMFFNKKGKFIDYGGGYGLFVRMMRDRGFDFYRQDIYCENLFAKNFDVKDTDMNMKFELLTAFEVFEHLEDPFAGVEKMLEYADNILFSTELQPLDEKNLDTWWYIAPETGQHIAFYTLSALEVLAYKFGLHLCSTGNYHLLSREKKTELLFAALAKRPVQTVINKFLPVRSLLQSDFTATREKVNIELMTD